jgi:hypothetical protein
MLTAILENVSVPDFESNQTHEMQDSLVIVFVVPEFDKARDEVRSEDFCFGFDAISRWALVSGTELQIFWLTRKAAYASVKSGQQRAEALHSVDEMPANSIRESRHNDSSPKKKKVNRCRQAVARETIAPLSVTGGKVNKGLSHSVLKLNRHSDDPIFALDFNSQTPTACLADKESSAVEGRILNSTTNWSF